MRCDCMPFPVQHAFHHRRGRLLSEPIEVHARDFVRAYSRASPKGEVVLADLFKLRSGDEFVQG